MRHRPPSHTNTSSVDDLRSAAPNGLVSGIHRVRRVAWLLRDRISVDAWLILNQLDQQFRKLLPPRPFV